MFAPILYICVNMYGYGYGYGMGMGRYAIDALNETVARTEVVHALPQRFRNWMVAATEPTWYMRRASVPVNT